MTTITAALIIIGNEVLSGRTVDKNLPYLAEKLNAQGIQLAEARIVQDIEKEIIDAVTICRARYDYVFTTGGIGPTHDDITTESVAKAFKVPVIRDENAVKMLQEHYTPEDLNQARLKMADVPEGAILIENPISKAPGYRISNVIVMAGVPRIMQAMLDFVLPTLKGGLPRLTRTVTTSFTEGVIADYLTSLQRKYPVLEIGSYPYFKDGNFGVSVVLRGLEEKMIADAVTELQTWLDSKDK